MEILSELCSPVAHMPAHKPRPWFMGLEMYNQLAPLFGHDPIPMTPLFPTTDKFIMNWKNISIRLHGQEIGTIKQYKQMTEQSLIEYAIAGDTGAIDYLAAHGFKGVDWKHAITHVNGRWLPGNEIVLVWNEMVKLRDGSGEDMAVIKTGLQKALDEHDEKLLSTGQGTVSPAGRPWHFQQQHALKWGVRGTNRTPPKKKRK